MRRKIGSPPPPPPPLPCCHASFLLPPLLFLSGKKGRISYLWEKGEEKSLLPPSLMHQRKKKKKGRRGPSLISELPQGKRKKKEEEERRPFAVFFILFFFCQIMWENLHAWMRRGPSYYGTFLSVHRLLLFLHLPSFKIDLWRLKRREEGSSRGRAISAAFCFFSAYQIWVRKCWKGVAIRTYICS